MMQALESPFYRSLAVGGLLLALTAAGAAGAHSKSKHHRRLVLHTVWKCNTLYLSAWRHRDVHIVTDGGPLKPLTFETPALVSDGCRWLGKETLVPIDDRHYAYRYEETILSCQPGAEPFLKTPRTGFVTVED